VWLKDFEFPQPLIVKENVINKSNRRIIKISNPKKPGGNFLACNIFTIIRINKNTEKIRGSEIVPVNANAETKGMVKI
jgi:hypothetical protein